jgi:hypothetical protein
MMPVSKPAVLQRIDADNARRAHRAQLAASPENIKAASELYAPAPAASVSREYILEVEVEAQPKAPTRAPAPFYVNVYQLSPGRHFLGAPSDGPIYSNHAVYRLRVTLKAGPKAAS